MSRPGHSLPAGKTRYPSHMRLGEPRTRSGQVRKISPPPGFDPRTVHSLYRPSNTANIEGDNYYILSSIIGSTPNGCFWIMPLLNSEGDMCTTCLQNSASIHILILNDVLLYHVTITAVFSVDCSRHLQYSAWTVADICNIQCGLQETFAIFSVDCSRHLQYSVWTAANICNIQCGLQQTFAMFSVDCRRHLQYSVWTAADICNIQCGLQQTFALFSVDCSRHLQYSVWTAADICNVQCGLQQTFAIFSVDCSRHLQYSVRTAADICNILTKIQRLSELLS